MKKKFKTLFIVCLLFASMIYSHAQDGAVITDEAVIEQWTERAGKTVVEQRLEIGEEEIENAHAENLTNFLQRKGVQILSYGSYGLESKPSVRGFTDETVRVVIDGICVNNPQYGTFDFSSINMNQIEKIEIVKGGFTEGVSDEGSVGGTVYITMKKSGDKKELSSDTSVKTYFNKNFPVDTFRQTLNFSSPIIDSKTFFSASAGLGLAKNLYLYKDYKDEIAQRENSSVWDSSASISLSHFFDNGIKISASDSLYAGNKNCPGTETSLDSSLQKDYDNRLILNVSNPNVNDIFSWENNLAYITNIRFLDSNTEHSAHYINSLAYAAYFSYFGNPFFNQDAGFSFDGVFLDSTDDGKHSQFTFTLKSNSKLFFDSDWSLTVPLAFKFQGKNFAFVPKIGVNKKIGFGEFNINAYRMIQFPNMDDLYWSSSYASGNPNLLPEDGWGGEIGFNSFLDFLPFSVSVFTNYYRNKIQWSSISGSWRPENVASAFYVGFDFDFEKSFFNGILTIKFNCEYLHTMLLDKNNSLTYGKRIMWTPDFVASLIFDLNFDLWNMSVDANYTGLRYISNLNAAYMKPYVLLNASASFKGFKVATPYLKIENILFQDYEAVESYPMPLISMTLGCSLKFAWD